MSRVNSAIFFLGLSCFVLGANAKAADYIVPCHIKDSAECYLSSARKALPFIAAQADPLPLHNINADQGDLVFRLDKCVLTGLKQCKITKFERLDKLKASLVLECPVAVTGQYTLKGSLLGIFVVGNGGVEIKTDAIRLSFTILMKTYTGKDNEEHYKVAKFDYEYEPMTQVHYKFENLYEGDTTKAEPFEAFLNTLDGSKQVLKTAGQPVVEEVVKNIVEDIINMFFEINPSKDIELP